VRLTNLFGLLAVDDPTRRARTVRSGLSIDPV